MTVDDTSEPENRSVELLKQDYESRLLLRDTALTNAVRARESALQKERRKVDRLLQRNRRFRRQAESQAKKKRFWRWFRKETKAKKGPKRQNDTQRRKASARRQVRSVSPGNTVRDDILRDALRRLRSGDFESVVKISRSAREQHGSVWGLDIVEGLALLRAGSYEDALAVWQELWTKSQADPLEKKFALDYVAIESAKPKNDTIFRALAEEVAPADPESGDKRYCVYTALFGEYDILRPPLFKPDGVDFICFSDRERNVSGWDLRVIDPGETDPASRNRRIKILPFEYVGDYQASLYIDANILVTGDVSRYHNNWLRRSPFAAWPHPDRDDILLECEAVLAGCRFPPESIVEQYRMFVELGVPRHTGLLEACILWRDHSDPDVRDLMNQWWDHVEKYGARDQPGLGWLMWKTGIRPDILPDSLGTARSNAYFEKLPHKKA